MVPTSQSFSQSADQELKCGYKMGLQWRAHVPPPLLSSTHSLGPQHKLLPSAGTDGLTQLVSETGSTAPSHSEGKVRDVTFLRAYSAVALF